jgi:hypothetical protein
LENKPDKAAPPAAGLRLGVQRADGIVGHYSQADARRAQFLLQRCDPRTMFRSGPIVIGVFNPFTVLNADEVCWISVETGADSGLQPAQHLPEGIDHVRVLPGRVEYEALLARQWPKWRRANATPPDSDLLEALLEVNFRGAEPLFLHVLGKVTKTPLVDTLFGEPAIAAAFGHSGMVYINTRCMVRARLYHSKAEVNYPDGIWMAEADDI